MNFKLSALVAATLVTVGCATKPEPVVATPQPIPVQTTPPVRNYEPAPPPPESVVKIPDWYITPPVMTAQSIYTAGTATSTNLNMATHKAMLDADTKLAFQMESSIKAMLKSYQVDMTNDSVEHTELVAKKIASIVINGHVQSDMQVVQEGKKFRVFILMRYPLAGVNYFGDRVRELAAAEKARKASTPAHIELDAAPHTVTNETPVITEEAATTTVVPVQADAAPVASQDATQKLKSEVDAALSAE